MMWRGVVFARVNARVCHVPLQTSFTDDSLFTGQPSLHSYSAGHSLKEAEQASSTSIDLVTSSDPKLSTLAVLV
jgi:hypothetical protein